jgi:hypothetical protein
MAEVPVALVERRIGIEGFEANARFRAWRSRLEVRSVSYIPGQSGERVP